MSVLLERHDPTVFGNIPDLHDAVNDFAAKEARSLIEIFGKIFWRHGVCENFGLVMVHRHFDMGINEILVETVKDDHSMSLALPMTIKDGQVSPTDDQFWKSFDLKAKPYVIAQTWSFSKSGELQAFEFLATDKGLPPPPTQFIAELYQELKRLGLENTVGLRRIDNMKDRSSWENTPDGCRANIVTFGEKPDDLNMENVIRILWYFNSQGELKEAGLFCGYCNNCNHCDQCTHNPTK